ncbi:hypothetical protein [Methylobacterium sp. J-076]|uniref:hypothetical protein n=1 Tax=Methylobacterium sp. J-076 TaxID=2836655 RepID=UPI001FBB3878|nr:hypothetical protein [Methylobacterium sp. J-076]MCJ2011886.1 hypothetical protein [Methylobacterium sp. J-076]
MPRDPRPDAPTAASDDEKVGYGRPPSQFRIQPGETRNPWGRKGRPKSREDFLDGKLSMRVDGRVVKVTRDEAIDHFLFEAASKRNVSAAKLLEQRRQARLARSSQAQNTDTLLPEEEASLLRAVGRRLRTLDRETEDDEPVEDHPEPEADP